MNGPSAEECGLVRRFGMQRDPKRLQQASTGCSGFRTIDAVRIKASAFGLQRAALKAFPKVAHLPIKLVFLS